MRLLDREILRCEGKIPQLAPSAQLRGKLLYNVSLRASESSECFGDSEGARLGKILLCSASRETYFKLFYSTLLEGARAARGCSLLTQNRKRQTRFAESSKIQN